MGSPKIYLLETNPKAMYECSMCKSLTRKNKFHWESWFTGDVIHICRDCAYKESFGTKNIVQAKRENRLEQEKNDK